MSFSGLPNRIDFHTAYPSLRPFLKNMPREVIGCSMDPDEPDDIWVLRESNSYSSAAVYQLKGKNGKFIDAAYIPKAAYREFSTKVGYEIAT